MSSSFPYSPAHSIVSYEPHVFPSSALFTQYHGPPTDATDKAWESLYNIGVSRITKKEAMLLTNWTEEIPDDPGHYIVSLDIFHQLHCLNIIRKALWPQRYGPQVFEQPLIAGQPAPDHLDHCVNTVRESLICNADVTPNVWQWSDIRGGNFPRRDENGLE
ncbi:hypothetical protein SISNIDRAFT_456196 [Sistotremastrum niveocremeum HHB9708]|uniref:Tat pathway signal sequence n=1 Tax=Sistotremastrum niveocremeum HHB9708 TaxID=1314777 RepID=A0A164T1W3_9AGAM|nr:hypothetical protein SISNIDRAFT_456196 [Sistotremastrum niveocremeum HHB9708]